MRLPFLESLICAARHTTANGSWPASQSKIIR
nr:MAG TPA: hypothetical protein [Inoviridae sp.]